MNPRFLFPVVLLILLAAASAYQLSYAVVRLNEEIASIDEELRVQRQQLRTLQADWAFLSRPERLERQAAQLDMVATTPRRVVRIDQLGPMRELELAQTRFVVQLPSGREFEIRTKPVVPVDLLAQRQVQ